MSDFDNYTPFPALAHIYLKLESGEIFFKTDDENDNRKLFKLDGGFAPPAKIALMDSEKQVWYAVIKSEVDFRKIQGNEMFPNTALILFTVILLEIRGANGQRLPR